MKDLNVQFIKDSSNSNIAGSFFILNPENVIKYYIEQDHTFKETLKYFNTTRAKLYNFLKQNNISKDTTLYLDDYLSKINKAEFEQDYKQLGLEKCKTKYKIKNNAMFYKILKSFNINKLHETVGDLAGKISKTDFENYYMTHSRADTELFFNLSSDQFKKLTDYFNIKLKRINTKQAVDIVSKEDLVNYYIIEDHSFIECKNYFKTKYNLENFPLQELLEFYNISKLNYSGEQLIKIINNSPEPLTMHQLADKLNTGYCNITHLVSKFNFADKISLNPAESTYESEIKLFLDELNINYIEHDRSVLAGQEIDIYIPDNKIGIEFNGNYWHSDIFKDKQYHINKAKLAAASNVRLIQIWEYEWLNPEKQQIIKSLIKIAVGKYDEKIYARNCQIKLINNTTTKDFLNKNHLQGFRNAQIAYGLFYKDELVQVMSFSKSKYNKNLTTDNAWEIIRSCTKLNTIIVGGINKILKYFILENSPDKIFSYCDFNKFIGTGYLNMGMTFIGYTGPNMKWLLNKNLAVDRNPKNRKKLEAQAIAKLWQAGSLKFELILK